MRARRSGDVFLSCVPVVVFWSSYAGTMRGLFFFLRAMGALGFLLGGFGVAFCFAGWLALGLVWYHCSEFRTMRSQFS
jgi:hypothetical protein